MFFISIMHHYLHWHYSTALISYLRVYKNLWWYLVQLFSLPQLSTSLLSPYKRMTETRSRFFSLEDFASRILINTISRLIGLTIRLAIISTGLVMLTAFTFFGVIGYAVWLGAPMLIISSVIYGFYLIF